MEKRNLGKSDLKVTPICVGCWQFNDNLPNDKQWEPQPFKVSKSIADKALECGVNFFDTAEAYPNSHGVVGRIFEGRRRDVFLADKFGYPHGVVGRIFEGRRRDVILADKFGYRDGNTAYRAEEVEESIKLSLEKLKTDYIDLYQVHWANIVADQAGVIAELKRQQSLGRIRYYGLCNYGPKDLSSFLAAGGEPVSDQVCYNLLWRGMEYEIRPLCEQNNMSVLAYSPLQQGLLCGRFTKPEDVPVGRRRTKHFKNLSSPNTRHGGEGAEKETFQTIARIREVSSELGLPMSTVSLSWLLQQPQVAATIVGASRPDQIEQNVKITKLSQEALNKLSLSSDELKKIFAGEMDMWNQESRVN